MLSPNVYNPSTYSKLHIVYSLHHHHPKSHVRDFEPIFLDEYLDELITPDLRANDEEASAEVNEVCKGQGSGGRAGGVQGAGTGTGSVFFLLLFVLGLPGRRHSHSDTTTSQRLVPQTTTPLTITIIIPPAHNRNP